MAKPEKPETAEQLLIDLPLRPDELDAAGEQELDGLEELRPGSQTTGEKPPAAPPAGPAKPPAEPSLFAPEDLTADQAPAGQAPSEPLLPAAAVTVSERLRAGLADLAVQLMMLAVAVMAAARMGVDVTLAYWPPFAILALVFSFLYWIVPLAFWGQTPGMAWVGHLARSRDGEPLTFPQTALRWLGALLTLGLAGIPMLLALSGRSLSDRISDSDTDAVG